MAGAGRFDGWTVAGIAAVAGVLSTQLHEAGGHGGACLLLGRHLREWGAFYVDCDTRTAPVWIARTVAAAGSTMNLLVALVAAALFRATPADRPALRLFWWLLAAVDAFDWAGYFLFSGVSGVGDWGGGREQALEGVPAWPVVRWLMAAAGGVLYWLCARLAVRALAGLTGADEAGRRLARRLAATAYWTIGCVALVIGLMNPVGVYILLASAVASSFGGPSALLWAPRYLRPGPPADPPFVLARRWGWIAVGAALVVAEGVVLGPSLRF